MSTSARLDHLLDRQPVHEHVEHRSLDRVRIQPLRHRQVPLRVEVDQQHAVALLGERDAEIQRRRRLRDAALLVRERDHLCRARRSRARGANVRTRKQAGETHVDRHFGSAQRIPSVALRSSRAAARARASPSARAQASASAEAPQLVEQLAGAAPPPRAARCASSRASTRSAVVHASTVAGELCRALCRLLQRSATRRGSGDAQRGRRPRPQPEQRVVERVTSSAPAAVQQRLDERPAHGVARVAAEPLGAQRRDELAALPRLLGEQHGGAHRRGPRATVAAEQAVEALAHLRRAERLLGEERQLPAVERLAELAGPRRRASAARAARRRAAPRSLSSRVASPRGCVAAIGRSGEMRSGRKSSRSNTTGPAAIAPAVARRSARDRVGELGGRVGRLGLVRLRARASSSSTSSRSTSRPNSGGISPCASGQSCEISPATIGRSVMPPPRSASRPAESPTTRCERDVGARGAEQRPLEIGVGGVEGVVVPVEPAAALGRPGQHRQQDRAEERIVAGGAEPGVRAREDRRGRLALQIVDRVARIGQPAQRRRLLVDEAAHERPVLVERRSARASRAPRTRTGPARRARRRTPRGRRRAGTRRGAERAAPRGAVTRRGGSSPAWHPGHQ